MYAIFTEKANGESDGDDNFYMNTRHHNPRHHHEDKKSHTIILYRNPSEYNIQISQHLKNRKAPSTKLHCNAFANITIFMSNTVTLCATNT